MPRRRTSRKKLSEVDLAAKIVAWLEADSWDVYQEVDGVDIVAVRGPVLWAIECKTILGFPVLEQAMRRRAEAHCVWIATPPRRKSQAVVRSFCSYAGIGWATVSSYGTVTVQCRPEFNRKSADRLRRLLRPEHKTYAAAGSPTGRAWTPFKETCQRLLAVVSASPGIPLGEAMSSIKHHYSSDSSARRSVVKLLERKVIPKIRSERRGRELLLFPDE